MKSKVRRTIVVLKLAEGDMTIIPRGMEHKPVARDEGTLNTGNRSESERKVAEPEWV